MDLKIFHTFAEEFHQHRVPYNKFLKEIADSGSPAVVNMGPDEPAGLCYLADNNKRWTKSTGQIDLLKETLSGRIVGVSAVEHSTLSDKLGSGGNRCWLLEEFRRNNEVSQFLLASNLEWCKTQNKLGMMLTFNEYNKILYDTVVRIRNGKAGAVGSIWSSWWDNCIPLPRKIRLFSTLQWAIIKPIFPGYELDTVLAGIDSKFGVRDAPYKHA